MQSSVNEVSLMVVRTQDCRMVEVCDGVLRGGMRVACPTARKSPRGS